MVNEGDVNGASTTNIHLDGGKKNRNVKNNQKGNEEVLPHPTTSDVITSHPPSITEESDDELGEDVIDVSTRKEWVARMEVARQAMEILGRRMNVANNMFKNLEEIKNILKSWRVASGTSLR